MIGSRKVKHGTPIHHKPSLCLSCRNATVVQGLAESDKVIYCSELPRYFDIMNRVVDQCSKYDDRRTPPLGEMKKIAWPIVTDKSGKQVGFMSPQDFRKREEKDGLSVAPLIDPRDGQEVY
jgi:hypothetical protein